MEPGFFGFPGPESSFGRFDSPLIAGLFRSDKIKIASFLVSGSYSFALNYAALLTILGSGGGGGGGGSNTPGQPAGSGGGAASIVMPFFQIFLPTGVSLSITVGTGGNGGTTTTNGSNGGQTTISMLGATILTLPGGSGGISYSNGAAGGAGGAGLANGLVLSGDAGQTSGYNGGYAQIMRFSRFLIKYTGGPGAAAAQAAVGFGCGGSGGNISAGGNGKNGFIDILYAPFDTRKS